MSNQFTFSADAVSAIRKALMLYKALAEGDICVFTALQQDGLIPFADQDCNDPRVREQVCKLGAASSQFMLASQLKPSLYALEAEALSKLFAANAVVGKTVTLDAAQRSCLGRAMLVFWYTLNARLTLAFEVVVLAEADEHGTFDNAALIVGSAYVEALKRLMTGVQVGACHPTEQKLYDLVQKLTKELGA